MDVTLVILFQVHGAMQMILLLYIYICEEYAKEFDIQFNPSKSKLMCFNNKDSK